jgi:hypothetical protein
MSLRNFSRASLLILACAGSALALFGAACGSESDDDGPGGAGASSSTGNPASSGTGGSGAAGGGPGSGGTGGGSNPGCDEPPNHPGQGPSLVVENVQATLHDTDGNPIGESEVQLCGTNLCLYGTTGPTGDVSITGTDSLDRPAFKFGDGTGQARFAMSITEPTNDFGTLVTVALPSEGVDIAIGTPLQSGPMTLELGAESGFAIDELTWDEPHEILFRAASMDPTLLPAGVGVPAGIVTVYGVAPLETVFCPPAQVTVTNEADLPPDSVVEFWAHGVDIFELAAEYGSWRKVSEGKVSADGATISTLPEEGIEVLTTFGIKLAE